MVNLLQRNQNSLGAYIAAVVVVLALVSPAAAQQRTLPGAAPAVLPTADAYFPPSAQRPTKPVQPAANTAPAARARRLPPIMGPVTVPPRVVVPASIQSSTPVVGRPAPNSAQWAAPAAYPARPVSPTPTETNRFPNSAAPRVMPPVPPAQLGPVSATSAASQIAPEPLGNIQLVQALQSRPNAQTRMGDTPPTLKRLHIPPGLPGADAPPIRLPPFSPENPQERSEVIDRLFPRLPGPPVPVPIVPGPQGVGLTYENLLEIARNNNPLIQQARADIIAARGNAIHVGALPNPQIGYEMDTVGRREPNQYVGGLLTQQVVTAGKLRLQRSSALQDVRNAEIAFRRTDIDLATHVQAGFYAVLVAQEAMKVTNALVQFTDETYRVLVEQTKGGEAAPYEPLQLRVLATQARAAAIQAHNRYISAWAQLTALLATPQMPPTQLMGRVDAETPEVCWDLALDRTIRFHTDVAIAQTSIVRERFDLRRQEVEPIPDINTYLAIQKDNMAPPERSDVSMNLQTAILLPIFYRNQGGILQAQGQLMRATQDVQRVQNDLITRLAATFERYQNARRILILYRNQILPDQARAYRGVFERAQQEPATVSFGDVVVAQQILATTVNAYIALLNDQWNAVADLENVTQTLDLSTLVDGGEVVPPPPPGAPANAPAPGPPPAPPVQPDPNQPRPLPGPQSGRPALQGPAQTTRAFPQPPPPVQQTSATQPVPPFQPMGPPR